MVKIFIAGGDGAGKSTLARHLSLLLHIPVFSFGSYVRKDLAIKSGITLEELQKKPTPPHLRYLLRTHGQNMKLIEGLDVWVKAFDQENKGLESYIIDDMRFKVELNYAKSVGGLVIYLGSEYDPNIPSFEDLEIVNRESDISIKDIRSVENQEILKFQLINRLNLTVQNI